jgi:hypothetical protein
MATISAVEKTVELTAEEKAEKEAIKMHFEVYKHLTTLGSGSMVLVIVCTFLEKFFKTPISLHFVTSALVCFPLSIIGSIYVMSHLAMEQKINHVSSKTADIV